MYRVGTQNEDGRTFSIIQSHLALPKAIIPDNTLRHSKKQGGLRRSSNKGLRNSSAAPTFSAPSLSDLREREDVLFAKGLNRNDVAYTIADF